MSFYSWQHFDRLFAAGMWRVSPVFLFEQSGTLLLNTNLSCSKTRSFCLGESYPEVPSVNLLFLPVIGSSKTIARGLIITCSAKQVRYISENEIVPSLECKASLAKTRKQISSIQMTRLDEAGRQCKRHENSQAWFRFHETLKVSRVFITSHSSRRIFSKTLSLINMKAFVS